MTIHLIAVALTTQNPVMSNVLVSVQRHTHTRTHTNTHSVSHRDPKCHHSIMGDSDVFHLLMACEVPAAARESRAITHIGNPCLMFRLTVIFLKPNRPENV